MSQDNPLQLRLEECFFHETDQQNIYCIHYAPSQAPHRVGIIIVPPVGHERLRCYRECVNLARDLATQGYHVLRFDYRGEGESDGDFENTDIRTRLSDIGHAHDLLVARSGIEYCCLVGFRLGALLALISAGDRQNDCVVLCDPISNVKSYCRSLFRANLIMQQEYFGRLSYKEIELRDRLRSGDIMSVYGFHYANRFISQMEEINEQDCLYRFKGQSLLLPFTRNEFQPSTPWDLWHKALNRNGHCTLTSFVTDFSWGTKKIWTSRFNNLDMLIASWLQL